jgi:hypothetical protein
VLERPPDGPELVVVGLSRGRHGGAARVSYGG